MMVRMKLLTTKVTVVVWHLVFKLVTLTNMVTMVVRMKHLNTKMTKVT